MKSLLISILAAVLVLTVCSVLWINTERLAAAKADPANQVHLPNVVKIFMHLPYEYTFVTEEKGELKLHHFEQCSVQWLLDAPDNEPMRAEGFLHNWNQYNFTVHLHDADEINGAGWQRKVGKQTVSGQTIEVE